ncbi:DUF3558 domain-containing protein [Amycolatopsis tolypomycina]|uniref:DUF3558 domain-containing protein n=1 Tax=Amycolatopsis tolypomycina TaxID=208445 RepID=UPI0033B27D06
MRRTLILLGAALLTLTACTNMNTGTPTPVTGTSDQVSSSSVGKVPGPGVPKVDQPIDTTRFKQAPCDSLTTAQVTELLGSGITPKSDLNAQGGPSCYWNVPDVSQASVAVVYNKVTHVGLTAVYGKQGTGFPFFMPMDPIDGYPTVAYGLVDERSKGRCAIALGTSDQDLVDVSIAQSEANIGKNDPCAAAHDVTAKVLDNLRKVN